LGLLFFGVAAVSSNKNKTRVKENRPKPRVLSLHIKKRSGKAWRVRNWEKGVVWGCDLFCKNFKEIQK
jgi:hypothetical protein